jgi:hypothetical protein
MKGAAARSIVELHSVEMHRLYVHLQNNDVAKAFAIRQKCSQDVHDNNLTSKAVSIAEILTGGVGERLKPPVLKTGAHTVGRGFESRPLRHRANLRRNISHVLEY